MNQKRNDEHSFAGYSVLDEVEGEQVVDLCAIDLPGMVPVEVGAVLEGYPFTGGVVAAA